MTKKTCSGFTLEKIKYYHQEMEEKEKQGHLVSYIDMTGLIIEELLFGQVSLFLLLEQDPFTDL